MTLIELCQHTGVWGGIVSAITYANTHDLGYLWGTGLALAAIPAGILGGTLLAVLLTGLMSLGFRGGDTPPGREGDQDRGDDTVHRP